MRASIIFLSFSGRLLPITAGNKLPLRFPASPRFYHPAPVAAVSHWPNAGEWNAHTGQTVVSIPGNERSDPALEIALRCSLKFIFQSREILFQERLGF